MEHAVQPTSVSRIPGPSAPGASALRIVAGVRARLSHHRPGRPAAHVTEPHADRLRSPAQHRPHPDSPPHSPPRPVGTGTHALARSQGLTHVHAPAPVHVRHVLSPEEILRTATATRVRPVPPVRPVRVHPHPPRFPVWPLCAWPGRSPAHIPAHAEPGWPICGRPAPRPGTPAAPMPVATAPASVPAPAPAPARVPAPARPAAPAPLPLVVHHPRPAPLPPPPIRSETAVPVAHPLAGTFAPATSSAPDAVFLFVAITIPALIAAATGMFHVGGRNGRR